MVGELLHWLLNQSLHMYQIAKVLSPRDIIYQIEKVLSPRNITSISAKHCHEIQDLEEFFKDFESQLEKKKKKKWLLTSQIPCGFFFFN